MIKRATAERYISALPGRAQQINAGDYAYTIVKLEVFGSYLTDKDPLGDLDVIVWAEHRHADVAKQDALERERRRVAIEAGRTFPTFLDELYWPREEVDRLLKSRNTGLSLHHSDERPHLSGEFRCIWALDKHGIL